MESKKRSSTREMDPQLSAVEGPLSKLKFCVFLCTLRMRYQSKSTSAPVCTCFYVPVWECMGTPVPIKFKFQRGSKNTIPNGKVAGRLRSERARLILGRGNQKWVS